MIDIKFKTIRLWNFRRYPEAELDFENGLTAIIGPNGAGKTTFFHAVMAVLYDRTSDGLTIGDLLNNRKKKGLLVELDIDIDDVHYRFLRAYKHKQHGDKLKIFRGDIDDEDKREDLTGKTNTETFGIIEAMILPRDVFLNTIYFSQQIKDFFTALTDTKQKDIFEAILRLQEWGVYLDSTKKFVKEVDEKLDEDQKIFDTAQLEIEYAEKHVEHLVETIGSRKRELAEKIEETQNKINSLNEEIVTTKKQLKECSFNPEKEEELRDKVTAKTQEIRDLKIEFEQRVKDRQTERDHAKKTISNDVRARLDKLDQQAKLEFTQRKEKLTSSINEIDKKKLESNSQFDKQISTLKSEEQTELKQLEEQIANGNTQIAELKSKYNIDSVIEKAKSKMAEFESVKQSLKEQSEVIKQKVLDNKESMDKLQARIDEDEKSQSSDNVICNECGQEVCDQEHLSQLKSKLDERKERLSKHQETDKKLRADFEKIKEKHSVATKQQKEFAEKSNEEISKLKQQLAEETDAIQGTLEGLRIRISETKGKFSSKEEIIEAERLTKNQGYEKDLTDLNSQVDKIKDEIEGKTEQAKRTIAYSEHSDTMSENNKCDEDCAKIKAEWDEKIIPLKEELQRLNVELDYVRQSKENYEKFQRTLDSCESQLSIYEETLNTHKATEVKDDGIEEKKAEIEKLKKKAVETKKKIDANQRQKDIAEFWKVGFSDKGIPAMLIDSTIPFMNKNIKEELELAAPGKFLVSFDTVGETKAGEIREKFTVSILNLETGAEGHKQQSGGEKRIIDVCSLKVLRNLTEMLYDKKFNVYFFDEVLDSIDEENSKSLCGTMRQMAIDKSITLISHSVDKIGDVDRLLRM